MAFFKSLLKKTEAAPRAVLEDDFPDLYNGMKVEVLTPANNLIFVGRLRVLGSELVEIRAEAGGFPPRAVYNQPVKLQGFQKNGESFTLNGVVGPNGPAFWRIEKLRTLQNNEKRSFFRQNSGVTGYVYSTTSSTGQKYSCKILDISAGGARVITEKLFHLEDIFQLEASLLPEEAPFSVPCRVKRILVRPNPGRPGKKFDYGCQFVDVPTREQDRLTQAIFTLQRKTLQARRER